MLGMLPLSAVRGPRDTLEDHLAGQDGPLWFHWLNRFNRREFREMRDDFLVWMTIIRGSCESLKAFRQEAATSRISVDQVASEMFLHSSFHVNTTKSEIDLTLLSPAQLGLIEDVEREVFFRMATTEAGLQLFLPGDALDFRRQYLCQPRYEKIYMAMKPIHVPGYNSDLFVFCVGREDRLYLSAARTPQDETISPSTVFAFVRSREWPI